MYVLKTLGEEIKDATVSYDNEVSLLSATSIYHVLSACFHAYQKPCRNGVAIWCIIEGIASMLYDTMY